MALQFRGLTPAQRERLLNGPALAPPKGVVPNFQNPENRNDLCFGVFVAGIVLVSSVVLIRVYAKACCMKRFRTEDFLMIAALGMYIGWTYVGWTLFQFPGGFVHLWNVRLKEVPHLLKGVNIASILYGVVMVLLKVAIFVDWIHIFAPARGTRGSFYYACVGNMVITILFYVACLLVEIFACTPRSKIWNGLEHGTCVNIYAVNVASSVFNFVLDLAMLVLPQRVIWKMHLSARRKVAISLLFMVGTVGCICGALRIVYSVNFMTSPDKSYHVTPFGLAATGEMIAGFLVLCIPAFPKLIKETPILRDLVPKLSSWIGLSSNKSESRLGLPSWIRRGGGEKKTRPNVSDMSNSDLPIFSSVGTQHTISHTPHVDVHHNEGAEKLPGFITVHHV